MKHLLFFCSFFSVGLLSAQSDTAWSLRFVPTYADTPFLLENAAYAPAEEASLQIETLRFYISQIQFYQGPNLVFREANSFHLVDAEAPETLQLSFAVPASVTFDRIKFSLGVDSLTNSAGALGGDLDPMHGMYWTWQSGYINFKLEGVARRCPARNHRFQFHLGGYQSPFNTLQEVVLPVARTKELKVKVAIDQFLAAIDLASDYQVMSPNQKAVKLSQQAAIIFSIIE